MGTKTEEAAKLAARKFGRLLVKLNQNARFRDFKIVNLVSMIDAGFPIRLEAMASKHFLYSHYAPEIFSGLVYRLMEPKVVLLVFVSGKVIVTGAKSRKDVEEALGKMWAVFLQFKKSF
eukprot:TRINITY_DN4494_c0_g1_i1.p1 TRINITY_DN4494_c0_g1~~TRINITY_DN4494_c0_g1_i1.p1  ORF type:complete len:119 (-),score=9.80 TRINITY_DN4494_c0_g1_i1:88-444(-)